MRISNFHTFQSLILLFLSSLHALQAESEWLPAGEWGLDWSDEFSGSGEVDQWYPMLGYTPTEFANNQEKGLRWNGGTEDTAQMYSAREGQHWLNGEGQLVVRASSYKNEANANGPKVKTAYLMSGYPERWDDTEPTKVKWAGKFVSPQDGALYISARVRTDQVVGHSTWFAFWLFSQTRAYNGNPVDGTEVDIIEIAKGAKSYLDHSFNVANHWAKQGGSESKQFNPLSDPPALSIVDVMDSEYHVYGLEWTQESMKCYVDGKLYYTFTENIPSDPVDMMLLLTMEFQPNAWDPDQGDGRTSGPYVSDSDEMREMSRALVDYVRVYVKVSESEAAYREYLEESGVEVGQAAHSDDPDQDRFTNLFEYVYRTNPTQAGDAIDLFPAMGQLSGAEINFLLGIDKLEPSRQYYTQTLCLPKELPVGVELEIQSTLNLPHFDDGSSTFSPYGAPIELNDVTVLQSYYQVEAMETAQRGFLRIKMSLG